jgi:hypothetical protein
MSGINKHYQPFVMVLSVTVILLVLSQFKTEFNIFHHPTKKIAPLGDIILKGRSKYTPVLQLAVTDSIILKDSISCAVRDVDPANILNFKKDSNSVLTAFFEALNSIKKGKKKIRIGYFGDSMIEGDLITQDLRNEMQDKFGGNGVGYVPITSVVSGFRQSIIHQFNGWTTHTLIDNVPANHVLGIAGYSFVPVINNDTSSSSSWVKYTAVVQKHLNKFYDAKLLYGKSSSENYVLINNTQYKLSGTEPVNELKVENEQGMQSLSAKFKCKSPVDIFGFSMESDSGAFVDNFSFRGNSGFSLVKVPQRIYAGTNNCLNYDLIILEYGLNVVSPKMTDFSWYERGMLQVINHFKASFPNSSILLISVGDKAYRTDGTYQTDPSVPLLVQMQKKMAEETGCAFWSLYDAMGGSGSMVKWVEGDTVLANKDYTHFNFRGAHKVGKLLYTKLMSEYSDYNKKHN